MRKPIQIAAVTASLLGGAVAGGLVLSPTLSGAQESDPSTTETTNAPDDTAPDTATPPGPGEAWVADALAPLVDDGTLTRDQADAVVDALAEARPRGGHGPGGRPGWFGADLDTVAEALGIDVDALRGALADGQSIAELAQAAGVDVDVVVDAVLAEVDARLAEAVADGHLDQERADALRAELAERLDGIVNGDLPLGGPGGRAHRGWDLRPHHRDASDAGTADPGTEDPDTAD